MWRNYPNTPNIIYSDSVWETFMTDMIPNVMNRDVYHVARYRERSVDFQFFEKLHFCQGKNGIYDGVCPTMECAIASLNATTLYSDRPRLDYCMIGRLLCIGIEPHTAPHLSPTPSRLSQYHYH
ncbi:hypothetical protein J6590_081405 [Homalodisca vitripennis]|nr:hypothetical protein J6590_081405 [Homalodisca vitripennis]